MIFTISLNTYIGKEPKKFGQLASYSTGDGNWVLMPYQKFNGTNHFWRTLKINLVKPGYILPAPKEIIEKVTNGKLKHGDKVSIQIKYIGKLPS